MFPIPRFVFPEPAVDLGHVDDAVYLFEKNADLEERLDALAEHEPAGEPLGTLHGAASAGGAFAPQAGTVDRGEGEVGGSSEGNGSSRDDEETDESELSWPASVSEGRETGFEDDDFDTTNSPTVQLDFGS